MFLKFIATFFVLCGCYSSLAAQAFTPPKGVHFLSSWEETHRQLADSGIDISSTYALELQANPIGGRDQGFTNASALWVACLVELGEDSLSAEAESFPQETAFTIPRDLRFSSAPNAQKERHRRRASRVTRTQAVSPNSDASLSGRMN